MRALVAGRFSVEDGGATAGDLLVRDVLCNWLAERRIAYDVVRLGDGAREDRSSAK